MKTEGVDLAVDETRAHALDARTGSNGRERGIRRVAPSPRACGPHVVSADASRRQPSLDHSSLRRVVRFVRQRLDAKLAVGDIAAAAGLERHVFERTFRHHTGLTPYDYVIRCRIRRAIRLLARSERAIAEIALDTGFACQSHFTRMFHKRTGTTPGAYRRHAKIPRFAAASRGDPTWP